MVPQWEMVPRWCQHHPPSHLVFLKDHSIGALFLADPGASVSLVPGTSSPQGRLLTAANGATITTGPERSLTIHLQDSQLAIHQCNFTFITADMEGPILGIVFLRKFHMTVDPSVSLRSLQQRHQIPRHPLPQQPSAGNPASRHPSNHHHIL